MNDKKPGGKRTTRKSLRRSKKNIQRMRSARNDQLKQTVIALADDSNWDGIINIVEPLLNRDDPDHWLLVQLAAAYHEKGDFQQSLIRSAEAMWVEYDCPLARWVFAYSLLLRGQLNDAISILEEFSEQQPGTIAHGVCGEGSNCNMDSDRAESVINDARLVIGLAYRELGYHTLFRYYVNFYKRHVERGCPTVYPDEILDQLKIEN